MRPIDADALIENLQGSKVTTDSKGLDYKTMWQLLCTLVVEAIENEPTVLPSADAVPTVIRAKTFMRKEDFDKWAEDIKRQNKSIVCIPADAEVVSADAVQGEWVEHKDCEGKTRTIMCSRCGYQERSWVNMNFCPNCGARMKGGAE